MNQQLQVVVLATAVLVSPGVSSFSASAAAANTGSWHASTLGGPSHQAEAQEQAMLPSAGFPKETPQVHTGITEAKITPLCAKFPFC